jgi:hypothetical protein
LPDTPPPSGPPYRDIKNHCLTKGIITQCFAADKAKLGGTFRRELRTAYSKNLVLKINAKLGGVNQVLR